MKRKLFIGWLIVLFLLAAPMDGTAASLWDNLVPQGEKKVGKIDVEYNQYPLSHYQLDLYLEDRSWWELDDKLSDTGHYFLHQIINTFWQVNVEFSRMVVWVVEEALNLDLVKEIGQSVGEGVKTLAGFNGNLQNRGFYGLFFPLMIVLLGGWVGWKALAEGDEDAAMRGLIHAFTVIFASFAFFYYIKDFSTEANRISSEISKGVMALAVNTLDPGDTLTSEEATVQVGNNLWDLMVMTPYKLLQFGTTKVDQSRVHALLVNPPDKKARVLKKEKDEYNNTMITTKSSGTRLGFVFMVIALNFVASIIIVMVAAGMPFYQLYFLFLLMFSPIALTWAIVPSWRDALHKWFSEVLGALLMKVALGALLAIYLSISGALYQFSISKGYFFAMLLQVVLLLMVIFKRHDIYQLVTMPVVLTTGQKDNQFGNIYESAMHKILGNGISAAVQGPKGKTARKNKSKKNKKGDGKPPTSSSEAEHIPTYIAEEVPKEEKPDLIFEPYDDNQALPHEERSQPLEVTPILVVDEPSEPEPSASLDSTGPLALPEPPKETKEQQDAKDDPPLLLVGETTDDKYD